MELNCIGKRIRERRLEKSWSQEQLAEKAGLSPVYIGMIERGEKLPKLETFIRLTNTLETSADKLMMDVLEEGYKVRLSAYVDSIEELNKKDQKRIYGIIEAFLQVK